MSRNNKQKGVWGEKLALNLLTEKKHQILKHNFFSQYGEIDIISLDNDVLVFTEVKTRSSNTESALSSVSLSKQKKIINTAYYFLQLNPQYEDNSARFDVITVIIKKNKNLLHHFEDAFFPEFS